MDPLRLFQMCLHTTYTDVENDVSFAVQQADGRFYILFEWSRGCVDWKNNLDFPIAPYRDMQDRWYCHRGFLRAWKTAEPYVEKILQRMHPEKITVAGFSHGGALATFCYEYIWFHHPGLRPHLAGMGFGAPRVVSCPTGCDALAARWANYTVVRNLDDIVTHLPPKFMGYRHVGRLWEIGKKGRYTSFDAHRPENYISSLMALSPDEAAQFPV